MIISYKNIFFNYFENKKIFYLGHEYSLKKMNSEMWCIHHIA
jgi:hypothetical protein